MGALGVQFTEGGGELSAVASPTVEILGYPMSSPDDQPQLGRCAGTALITTSFGTYEGECGLAPGSSGGPWIAPDDAFGRVVAVTSYMSSGRAGWLGSARLGPAAQELWVQADLVAGR